MYQGRRVLFSGFLPAPAYPCLPAGRASFYSQRRIRRGGFVRQNSKGILSLRGVCDEAIQGTIDKVSRAIHPYDRDHNDFWHYF